MDPYRRTLEICLDARLSDRRVPGEPFLSSILNMFGRHLHLIWTNLTEPTCPDELLL